MKMYTDQDLHDELKKLKNDDVEIQTFGSGKGDQSITIQTKHYKVVIGANDLGV